MSRSIVLLLVAIVGGWTVTPAREIDAIQPEQENLVHDSSVEGAVGENNLPNVWQGGHSHPKDGYQFSVDDNGRTGDRSLLIQGEGSFGVVSTNKVEIDPIMRYRARGWVKIEGNALAAADVKFHYFDVNQRYLGQTRIPFVSPPTAEWTLLEVTDRVADFPKAIWIQVAVALAGDGKAWYDDLELTAHRRDGVSDDFDLSPEQRILNRWTGKWKVQVSFEPAKWTPDAFEKTEIKTCKWILQNQFLEESRRDAEARQEDVRPEVRPSMEQHRALFGYDAKKKNFRIWFFDAHGNATTATGTWDKQASTMIWTSDLGIGAQMNATHRFIDEDTYDYKFNIKDQKGQLLMDGHAMHHRIGQ